MNQMEKKMLDWGFTPRELSLFRRYIEEDALLTHLVLLNELKNRFLIVSTISVLAVVMLLINCIDEGSESLITTLLTTITLGVIVYITTPMKLAFKAYRFLNKNQP